MSVELTNKVKVSALPKGDKCIAMAYADIGSTDGYDIYPSNAYIAWLTGYSLRSVTYATKRLEKAGVLARIGKHKSGTTSWFLDVAKLPKRAPWRTQQTARDMQSEQVQAHKATRGKGKERQGVLATGAPNPLTDPLIDPPKNKKVRDRKCRKCSKCAHFRDLSFPLHLQQLPFTSVLREWIENRHTLGKHATTLAVQRQINKLEPFTLAEATGLVEASIAGCWSGIVFNDTRPQGATVARAKPVNPGGGAI